MVTSGETVTKGHSLIDAYEVGSVFRVLFTVDIHRSMIHTSL